MFDRSNIWPAEETNMSSPLRIRTSCTGLFKKVSGSSVRKNEHTLLELAPQLNSERAHIPLQLWRDFLFMSRWLIRRVCVQLIWQFYNVLYGASVIGRSDFVIWREREEKGFVDRGIIQLSRLLLSWKIMKDERKTRKIKNTAIN